VPGKRVSMRKTHEVLRLYFEVKLGQRQIGRAAGLSQSTVHEYLERFHAAGISWPLPAIGGNRTRFRLKICRPSRS